MTMEFNYMIDTQKQIHEDCSSFAEQSTNFAIREKVLQSKRCHSSLKISSSRRAAWKFQEPAFKLSLERPKGHF